MLYYISALWFCHPRIIKGLHLNFAPPSKPGLPMVLSIMLGRHFPKMFGFNEHDIQRIYPVVQNLVVESVKESGYMHIQATKPDTVGKRGNQFRRGSVLGYTQL